MVHRRADELIQVWEIHSKVGDRRFPLFVIGDAEIPGGSCFASVIGALVSVLKAKEGA